MGLLQNEDHKTEAELVAAGGTKAQLLNDSKIYITAKSIFKTLDDAITDGDIGGIITILCAVFTGTAITPTVNQFRQIYTYTGSSQQTFTGFGTLATYFRNGDEVIIVGSDDTNTLLINNNDVANGWLVNGTIELARGATAKFIYNSTLARMVQI